MLSIRGLAGLVVFFGSLLAFTAWHAHTKGKQAGMIEVQAIWSADRLSIAKSQAEESAKAREKEQELQAQINKQRKAHKNEINRLVRDHSNLVDSLRQRPERPASLEDMPKNPPARIEPPTGCTGLQLYRQDGEFLARETERADQLRIALRSCLADRAEIERQLN